MLEWGAIAFSARQPSVVEIEGTELQGSVWNPPPTLCSVSVSGGSHFPYLSLSLLICKMGIIILAFKRRL